MAILTVPTQRELTELSRAFSLGSLASVEGIQAGTVNSSYALELEAGRFFLRIYEEQAHPGAVREAALLAHLARAGIATPAPVPAKDGTLVQTVAGKPAALFPWVEGETLCQRRVTAETGALVGAALARIHQAGSPPDAVFDEGRFCPAELVVRCDRVARSTDPDARALAEPLRERVSAFARARRRDVPWGLVHGDLFRDNVLWGGGPTAYRIAALLDFESAHHGPFAYDLAVTILSWAYGSDFDPSIARGIVDGYRSVRELSTEEPDVLYDEAVLATLRFTITRITDDAIRVGKRWQRFVERREALERLGARGLREMLGL